MWDIFLRGKEHNICCNTSLAWNISITYYLSIGAGDWMKGVHQQRGTIHTTCEGNHSYFSNWYVASPESKRTNKDRYIFYYLLFICFLLLRWEYLIISSGYTSTNKDKALPHFVFELHMQAHFKKCLSCDLGRCKWTKGTVLPHGCFNPCCSVHY